MKIKALKVIRKLQATKMASVRMNFHLRAKLMVTFKRQVKKSSLKRRG